AMLPPISVVLAPYDASWPQAAAEYAASLRALGPTLVDIHHIGSTAVPGLAAKPIIDLLPLVGNLADLDSQQTFVEALGYMWHGEYGLPGRRFCTLSDVRGIRLVHLHFFETSSPLPQRHLAFRDYLRAHPDVAAAYEAEKYRARACHPDNSHAYSEEK